MRRTLASQAPKRDGATQYSSGRWPSLSVAGAGN